MAEAITIDGPADVDVEDFSFTLIVDDHDADVHGRDSMIRCIKQRSG
jgi:hypothetical protein